MGTNASTGRRQPENKYALTDRELQVALEWARGNTTFTTARHIHLSESTVKTHRSNIMLKTGARNGPNLIAVLITEGLISLSADECQSVETRTQ